MVFSSPIFLFVFLPIVLLCCLLPNLRAKNIWLLVFSIIFYAWGEIFFVFLILGSTVVNYFLGRWVDRETDPGRRRWAVAVAVMANVGLLVFFKYSNFAVNNLNLLLGDFGVRQIHLGTIRLPLGISFFTFHALSYVIDVYRRKWTSARNPADLALYIFFFPQLIAGPILRWNAMAPQIARRITTPAEFAEGVRRFICGLAKKVLIANAVALPADQIFGFLGQGRQPGAAFAWIGALCYGLQIYFDFSGYSDMAIGLGKMFGFQFIENFNYPYISTSIQEFWRRWHISLSTWFRDYVYIPLGGSRCSEKRTYLNLLIVFFLCGLWHGASWTFVVWGLYHGFFLILERTRFGKMLDRCFSPLRHLYVLLAILIGWVIFRADTLSQAVVYMENMAGLVTRTAPVALQTLVSRQVLFAILAGIIFSTPLWPWLQQRVGELSATSAGRWHAIKRTAFLISEFGLVAGLLILSLAMLAGSTYNPFIYFRF